ncbi:type I restriction endonuclease subunit R [Lentisalinibacter sediminis]|uniref:type I restriction endonuclease subunit R n=1 Tax=Lentisalinibacter sediminis TaxID=2992237 RepID=UPI00386DB1C4
MNAVGSVHREIHFEDHILEYLTEALPESERWLAGDPSEYEKAQGLYPEDVVGWLRDTAPEQWARIERLHGDRAKRRVLDELAKKLGNRETGGTLEVLRRGFSMAGAGTLQMSQSLPEEGRNEAVLRRYRAHRLRVVRQLKYNPVREWSIDLVFFVNGIPVATWEVKSDFTQDVESAIAQYKRDRSPRSPTGGDEPLLAFQRGALVHFAVSTTEAWMCTKLEGDDSYFLPFNQGAHGGAGNPPQPPGSDRYPVAYLWEETFRRDNLLRLIHRFFMFQRERKEDANGKRYWQETMFFPRYHQWQAVTALDQAVRDEGVGQRYLLEHSAGSGKTMTIAWLCHSLIRMKAENGEDLFSSVIVVTDRTVLDDQLREAIKQIDHQEGVIEGIERARGFGATAKSERLAEALLAGTPIITVTIQTFPFALEAIANEGGLAGRNFAVVIDEAHTSQTGQAASKLRAALTIDPEEAKSLTPDEVMGMLQDKRLFPPNVSYFAFTATPKHETLTLFGRPDADGKPRSFHLYSMRQAIEEEFILDVLRGYMPYRVARKLSEAVEKDERVDAKQASRALARWAALHPTNVSQKIEFIVEHFRRNVAHLLDHSAKAMIVSSSRAQAVMYKHAFDDYVRDHGYTDLYALVAFSGTVSGDTPPLSEHYPALSGSEFTEASLNDVSGDLREAFDTDDYQVMIVANKFQTGFDQPKLCAMYLDKRISGVEAVQTLSRLNRTKSGKDTTYVIDFANEPAEIVKAFRTYYEQAEVSEPQDLDVIYELKDRLDQSGLYTTQEVDAVAGILAGTLDASKANARLVNAVEPAVRRFNEKLNELNDTIVRWEMTVAQADARGDAKAGEEAEARRSEYAKERDGLMQLRDGMRKFVRLYQYIAQVVPLGDASLEKLARFIRLYVKRLQNVPMRDIDLAGLEMTHYRIVKREGVDTDLGVQEGNELRPAKGTISEGRDRQRERISEIIAAINRIFGEGATEAQQLKRIGVLAAMGESLRRNNTVRKQIDAGNSDDQIMQAGDAVDEIRRQVIDQMMNSTDKEDAERLLSDRDNLIQFAMVALKLARGDTDLQALVESV